MSEQKNPDSEPIDTKPVVLIVDASMLMRLARRRHADDWETTLLPLLERVTRMPNITVVMPAFGADIEARGIMEVCAKDGRSIKKSVLVNGWYQNDTERAHERMCLTKFLKNAYRIRSQPSQELQMVTPEHDANPRCIVWQTIVCGEAMQRIALKGYKKTMGHDIADNSVAALIRREMPFVDASVIVLLQDRDFEDKIEKKHHTTKHGMQVGYARPHNFFEAMYAADPAFAKKITGHEDCPALIADLESKHSDVLAKRDYIGRGLGAESIKQALMRGVALEQANISVTTPLTGLFKKSGHADGIFSNAFRKVAFAQGLDDTKISTAIDQIIKNNRPQDDKLTAHIARKYVRGDAIPASRWHHMLVMEACVWSNDALSEHEKHQLTDRLMTKWEQGRQERPANLEYREIIRSVMRGRPPEVFVGAIITQRSNTMKAMGGMDALQKAESCAIRQPEDILVLIDAMEHASGQRVSGAAQRELFHAMLNENAAMRECRRI